MSTTGPVSRRWSCAKAELRLAYLFIRSSRVTAGDLAVVTARRDGSDDMTADQPPLPHSPPPPEPDDADADDDEARVWSQIKAEARRDADGEPALASFLYATVLSHPTLGRSLAFHLANKLRSSALLSSTALYDLFGVLLDHATGVVIGETAVVGDGVSILHHVTLGGTGKAVGDRHPKIGDGVLIGAGATILGNVRIGAGAKIGAGSLVLVDVPPGATAGGHPARLLLAGDKRDGMPGGESMDHASFMQHWSDYTI
uniref:serine O-acetyltransferase n=1 Tax=Oryza brachyantha TaxID=4533 RepID=J3LAP6_ORYBR